MTITLTKSESIALALLTDHLKEWHNPPLAEDLAGIDHNLFSPRRIAGALRSLKRKGLVTSKSGKVRSCGTLTTWNLKA